MSEGEYIRPLCLYENTCLDKKQKTKDCKTCIHHTDYWTEVTQKELTEKVRKYEQKIEKIKEIAKTINDDTEHDYECWWYLEQVDKISQIISEVE